MMFDSRKYINEISQELILNFSKASIATTPSLKGAIREDEVRKKLENILPSGVGIGTGCVIDFNGNTSKQQDIILYEKDICPFFAVNGTAESTYYPCEGVIAVGEIKSKLGKKELIDSFGKIESVKKLQRQIITHKSGLNKTDVVLFRKYLSRTHIEGTKDEEFNQSKLSTDQIYGFILCEEFSIKHLTLGKHIDDLIDKTPAIHLPNALISLTGSVIQPYDQDSNQLNLSMTDGDSYVLGKNINGTSFEYLLARLYKLIQAGRSVEISAFEYYIMKNPDKMSIQPELVFPKKIKKLK